MIAIDDQLVQSLASPELTLRAAEDAANLAVSPSSVTGRIQIDSSSAWMRILAGIVPELDLLGYKEFHRVGRRVRYHVHLFRLSSGEALGVVDGRRITSLRTGATASVAVLRQFGTAPISVGVIGSGEEARQGLLAVSHAANLARAHVFSPTAANRERFAREMRDELEIPIECDASVASCLRDVQLAYVATSARGEPFLTPSHIGDLEMVAAIGSTRPEQREVSGDVFLRADTVVVDCMDALHEAGDLRDAVERGLDPSGVTMLGEFRGAPNGRSSATVFKSIGSVEQDLCLAYRVWEMAVELAVGNQIGQLGEPRIMR